MPTFQVLLHRMALGGSVRVTPRVNAWSEDVVLTDAQLRKRLSLIPREETDKIFSNLSRGRGEHRLSFTAQHWPALWNTEGAFLRYWRPDGGPASASLAGGGR